ncbi:MAG: type IV secretory system conjugative DNA transfer family protein [Solirubrobacteraceae bacterium]
MLIVGPPRSGKTSGVIIPAVIAHTGPAVSASTKPDVAQATRAARSRDGQTWEFDPTGAGGGSSESEELRWSPVQSSRSWDGALLMARAMTSSIGAGTTDRSHWVCARKRSSRRSCTPRPSMATTWKPWGTG